MTRVIRADLARAGLCGQGARAWFRRHGLDWQTFLETGIPAERLLETGCALAARAVAVAERREAGDG